jgi:hypothetical protein
MGRKNSLPIFRDRREEMEIEKFAEQHRLHTPARTSAARK